MKEKLIASFMAALMALMTTVNPVLGATALSTFPSFLGKDGTINFYVVMGAAADPSDVAGAVDIAIRLAELSYSSVSAAGASAVNGIEKDTIGLDSALSTVIPSPVKTLHYSGLKDSTYRWRSVDYDYYEDFVLGTTQMSHDFGTDKLNGTEKMVVSSGQVMYEFVFDKALSGTGSLTDKNYTWPVNIKLLDKDFSIVGTGSNSVVALVGTVGTASSTTGVTYGNYTVFSDLGTDNSWARIVVKDSAGNTVDTKVINKGDSWDFASIGLTVKVTAIRALQDGTIVGVDVVVGPTGTVERTYTTSCDVTSTGAEDKKFPGETEWCIQVSGFSTAGSIAKGDKIQVVFKPTETKYYVAGEKLPFPNNYGEIGFEGWNTDTFVTITASVTEVTVYNESADTQSLGTFKGIKIEADQAGSLIDPNTATGYDKVYLLFNGSSSTTQNLVMVAYHDPVKQKALVNTTFHYGGSEGKYFEYLDAGAGYGLANHTFNFTFNLSYGGASAVADQQYLCMIVNTSWPNTIIPTFSVSNSGCGDSTPTKAAYYNKTAWGANVPDFRLYTADSAEDQDVTVWTTPIGGSATSNNIGKAVQDVVSNEGHIVVSPSGNSGSQVFKVKIPAKTLAVKAYVGKLGGVTAAGMLHVIEPVKSAVAVMDTEVTATHKTKNFVSVGGPCVNSITAAALNVSFPTCGAAGAAALGISSGEALIKIVDDYPAAGLKTVVVAGYEKENTRTASTVLQQYDTLLAGQSASAVKVTSATAAGIKAL
jgi:hypothetical protein